MATLLLTAAGAAVGGLFGSTAAIVGQAIGGLAGGLIDRALFGPGGTTEVGRLADLDVQSSTEGVAIPRVFGRVRIAGQVIWATRFEETSRTESAGGKGGGPKVRTFDYFGNFAVALCEGPIARVGRVWANGELLDLTQVTMRVHLGEEDQDPDSLILARQGDTPAYRGTAYVVFERLPLAAFGNALPQLSFEVIRPVGRLERMIRGVTLIPAATEFGYATTEVTSTPQKGQTAAENRHAPTAATDVEAALDELQALCPNLRSVSVVVTWFGDDLRAGVCTLRPKVELAAKTTRGMTWTVAGLTRSTATVVGSVGGRPAFGGTPSDKSVVQLIGALKARGLAVTFYPFVMMDVPAGNALPNPSGGTGQPAYPWRGRITCHPAPGQPGSPYATAAAATQVNAFVGTAARTDFSVSGTTVAYAGPAEWSFRRMILHCAHLCLAAGGVDAFLIGSELRGLTTLRAASRSYPFVTALKALAADAKAVLGAGTAVSYAADWSEWFGHQSATGDVAFHLDPLWSDPSVDFVGIDAYLPLTDWREGPHADRAVADAPTDRAYLRANVAGGEGFAWYYASEADRRAGTRTPITDGLGKPWISRYKDFAGWWGNRHYDRIGGVEQGTPSGWLAGMKPIRFTEVGCPATDVGGNEPNVFPDALSSEGRAPRFSRGTRDDAMQRRYLEAMLGWFDPAAPGFVPAANPTSPIDGRRMVDVAETHLWTWDARPYPWFPLATDVWADGPNWQAGHWLNGRLGAAPLDDAVAALLAGLDVGTLDVDGLSAVVDGLAIADRASARQVLEPLAAVYGFAVTETATGLRFADRSRRAAAAWTRDDLAEAEGRPVVEVRRRQDEDLPGEVALAFLDTEADARATTVTARRAGPPRTLDLALPVSAAASVMKGRAEALIKDLDAGRETVRFALPPTRLAPEPGDVVTLALDGRIATLLVERIEDGAVRRIETRAVDPELTVRAAPEGPRAAAPQMAPVAAVPEVVVLDLPARDDVDPHRPWLAAASVPSPGRLAVHRQVGLGFEPIGFLDAPAVIGDLDQPLGAGRVWRLDEANAIEVTLLRGTLAAITPDTLLEGGNLAAVGSEAVGFEVLQFRDAVLVGPRRYRLSGLLRGQGGTEARAAAGHPAGATFVLLDAAVRRLAIDRGQVGRAMTIRVGPAARNVGDPSMVERTLTPGGAGLLPLSPVHLSARRDPATGDVALAWIRRTRVGGDDFEGVEVPLAEAFEAYEVTIRQGAAVKRLLPAAAPTVVYAAADQIADFGALPASIDVAVRQLSETMGPGAETRGILDV